MGSSVVAPYMSKEWGGLGGEKVAEFAVEEGAVAGVHGDDLEGHAGVCMNAADDGASANLSSGGIQQELHGTAKGYGTLSANEEAPEREAVHVRDVAGHAGLPSDDEGFRRFDARVVALVWSEHIEGQPGLHSLVAVAGQVQGRVKAYFINTSSHHPAHLRG